MTLVLFVGAAFPDGFSLCHVKTVRIVLDMGLYMNLFVHTCSYGSDFI